MIVLFLAKSFIFLMCKKVDFGQKKTVCKYLQKLQPKRYYGAQTKTKLVCNCHKKGDYRGLLFKCRSFGHLCDAFKTTPLLIYPSNNMSTLRQNSEHVKWNKKPIWSSYLL